MFDPLFGLLAGLLAFFYTVVPVVRRGHRPAHARRHARALPADAEEAPVDDAMQRLQPEMKKIQAQYKDDRQKLNEELMGSTRTNNINRWAGVSRCCCRCPIFIVLYRVLRASPHKTRRS